MSPSTYRNSGSQGVSIEMHLQSAVPVVKATGLGAPDLAEVPKSCVLIHLRRKPIPFYSYPYCVNLKPAPQQHRERLRGSPKISQPTQNLQHPLHIPRYMKYSLNPKTSYSLSTRSRENSRTLDPKSRKTLSAMSGALETWPCESAPQGQT